MSASKVTMNGGDSVSAANGNKQGEGEAKANGTGDIETSSTTTSTSTATPTKNPQVETASGLPSQNQKETNPSTNGNKTAAVSTTETAEKSPVNKETPKGSDATPTIHDTARNKMNKSSSDTAEPSSMLLGSVGGDEDGSALYIGEEGNTGGTSVVQDFTKNVPESDNDYPDDYQSYLTPIAYHGTYPEVDTGDLSAARSNGMGSLEHGVPPAGKETNHHHYTRSAKPNVHKGPRTATKTKIQNSHFQASSLPLRSTKELVDTYKSVSGLPRPLHFLWIKKKRKSHGTVPGQFEDANEQHIVGPQYDPKTLTPSQQLQRQLPQSSVARNVPMQQHFVPGTAPTYPPQFQTAPGQQPLYQRYGMPSMPPSQQLNAAMMQAQQNMQVPPAQMRQTATTHAIQDPRLMQARMELVNAYKKVCTLEINANGTQQQLQQLQPRR